MITTKTGATDIGYLFLLLLIYCSLIVNVFISDRFVWRRCSDPSCARYEDGKEKIELAAYSYDNGEQYQSCCCSTFPFLFVILLMSRSYMYTIYFIHIGIAPYTGENPNLLKEFSTTIYPDKQYELTMTMDETGLTVFGLNDPDLSIQLEMQSVQHDNLCSDNFYEGTVDGLYFGGTCTAPNNVIVSYISNIS